MRAVSLVELVAAKDAVDVEVAASVRSAKNGEVGFGGIDRVIDCDDHEATAGFGHTAATDHVGGLKAIQQQARELGLVVVGIEPDASLLLEPNLIVLGRCEAEPRQVSFHVSPYALAITTGWRPTGRNSCNLA